VTEGHDELTAEFWRAAERHELVRPVCDRCRRSFFTPQVVCPSCRSEEWHYALSDGVGVIYSYTIVHRAPDPRFTPPYVLAIVELVNEGWHLLTNIVDVPHAEVRLDMAVVPRWVTWEDRTLPAFTRVASRSEY